MAKDTINYNGQEFTPEEFQKAVDSGMIGSKNDTVQSNFMQQPHGYSQNFPNQGGLFTSPTAQPDVTSVVMGVMGSLLPRLYAGTTDILDPEFEIITGVDAASGSNPTSYAGTAPTPGDVKIGTHRERFGQFYMSTDKIMLPTAGGKLNRGDVSRQLVNGLSQVPLLPTLVNQGGNLDTFLRLSLYAFMVHYGRVTRRVLFNGSYAQAAASTETGYIKEFNGFDQLIKTGYVDLETSVATPAMDSIVENFSSVDFTTSAGIASLAELMENILFRLETIARDAAMDPVTHEIAMRDDLFYAFTRVFPNAYLMLGNSQTGANGERINLNGSELTAMRDDMYRNRYIILNGQRYAVNTESAIPRVDSGAGYNSTIYVIPTMAAGRRMTYLEGFNQANTEIQEFVAAANANYATADKGLWAMTYNQTGFAYEMLFAQQLRLVMRTPYLAAKIENVNYKLSDGYPRDAYPADNYYVNGGRYVTST